jgi:hypothetical protein
MLKIQSATIFSISVLLGFANCAFAEAPNRASQILTPALAKKLLGVDVQASADNTAPDTVNGATWVSQAQYSVKGGTANTPCVGMLLRHAGSKDEAKQIFQQSKNTFKGTDVAGLGDAAYRTKMPPQLDVLKGSNWLIINCGTFTKPDTAGEENAAKELLPKVAP